ncbi:hypothetical protein D9619_006601 [Psilocybe cf. subviscida]|uniref:F-box domain-containing protein n=1 Tax=Psilocybe cf. subviscida TaxID=2480587 RepID=A0A8H5B5L4_9AGAR|nr:hypothetical protein D9619_006601 [Psilocybe cf. subviscida]
MRHGDKLRTKDISNPLHANLQVMSTFASLPPEILYHIGSHLSIVDNKVLRYVCRYINQAVEPLALPSLSFCLKHPILGLLYAEKLNVYAERTTRATAHVRKLAVISENQLRYSNDRKTTSLRGIPNAPPASYQELLEIFLNLLLSLNNVDTFEWHLDHEVSEQVISKIFSFLSSQPIKKLKIMFDRPALLSDSLLPFNHPWIVRELVFTDCVSIRSLLGWHMDTVQLLKLPRRLIANCPDLEHLSLKTLCFHAAPQAPRLHDFLPHGTSNTNSTTVTTKPPLRLKSLSVSYLRMHLDQAMLYHLRSLQYLHIRSLLTMPEHDDPISTIMRTLRTEKIHLRGLNLNTFDVDDEVIEYLLSYSNTGVIQKITFENKKEVPHVVPGDESNVAKRFFAEVLPAVAGSLQALDITTSDLLDSWSFSPLYAEPIKHCHKLQTLCLSVEAEANNNAEAEKLNAYVERTTRATAHLRKLMINPEPFSEQLRAKAGRQPPPHQPIHPTVAKGDQPLLQTFSALLLSLDNVKTVDFHINAEVSERTITAVFSFLSLPSIRKLSVTLDRLALDFQSLLPFKSPWTVSELAYNQTSFSMLTTSFITAPAALKEALTKLPRCMIANCPNLERLSLRAGYTHTPLPITLHNFLHCNTDTRTAIATTPHLKLKSLSALGIPIHSDQAVLCHLRSLQYLYIRLPLTPERGDSISTIMRTLQTEKIHLRGLDLDTSDVDNEVIEYLLSYANTGIIRAIVFENRTKRPFTSAPDASSVAQRFFAEALPAVAGSLRSLYITTSDPSDSWSFRPWHAETIGLCHKLENLCLSVDGDVNNNAEIALGTCSKLLPTQPPTVHRVHDEIARIPIQSLLAWSHPYQFIDMVASWDELR